MEESVFSFTPEPQPEPVRGQQISFSAIGISTNPVTGVVRAVQADRVKLKLTRRIEAYAGEFLWWDAGTERWFDRDLMGRITILSNQKTEICNSDKESKKPAGRRA